MGMILFLCLAIIEITFAAYCVITKSKHTKERSIIRIASFIVFLLFVLLSIIEWSLIYYFLASYLLIVSIISLIRIIRGRLDMSKYRPTRIVFKTIGIIFLIFIVTIPAILFPQNKIEIEITGEYLVLSKKYTYIDESRVETYDDTGENRKLNVKIWYPDNNNDKYPLIVFSHGSLGVKSSNDSLYRELASHGYVVCSIDHTYQCFYTMDDRGSITFIDLGYMQELSNEDSQNDPQNSYELYQKWMSIRMGDIDFVIDKIKEEAEDNDGDKVYSLVDTNRIGVLGHSLGGSAALGIGRVRDDISAVIALEAPFMYDIEGVEEGLFVFNDDIYPLSLLNIYSDSSWDILDKRPQYAANYKMLSDDNEESYNILLSGVGHLGLTDFALTSPILTNFIDRGKSSPDNTVSILKRINKECLEFFNNYLK
jgi:dienelactone hydrolase